MRIEKRTFRSDKVLLDGNEFVGCHFDRCTLVYAGGKPPTLIGGSFLDCSWIFEGTAANTLTFLKGLYAAQGGLRKVILDTFGGLEDMPAPRQAAGLASLGAGSKRSRAN